MIGYIKCPSLQNPSMDLTDDDNESIKLVFAHSAKAVTSVLIKICFGKQFSF